MLFQVIVDLMASATKMMGVLWNAVIEIKTVGQLHYILKLTAALQYNYRISSVNKRW